jgi:quercetin dioxygenase-like cupin family protein
MSEVAGSAERKKKTIPSALGLQTFLLYVRSHGSVPVHQVPGPITVQAVLGNARISAQGQTYEFLPGSFVSIAGGVPHALSASTDSVLLVTHALQT